MNTHKLLTPSDIESLTTKTTSSRKRKVLRVVAIPSEEFSRVKQKLGLRRIYKYNSCHLILSVLSICLIVGSLFTNVPPNTECKLDTKFYLKNFLLYIFIPSLAARVLLQCFFNHVKDNFYDLIFMIEMYNLIAFGIYSIYGIYLLIPLQTICFDPIDAKGIIFIMIISVGVSKIIYLFLGECLYTLLVPIIIKIFKNQDEGQAIFSRTITAEALVKKKLKGQSDYLYSTCPICHESFANSGYLSILPCEKEHYYHTICAQIEIKISRQCPLCKDELSEAKLK